MYGMPGLVPARQRGAGDRSGCRRRSGARHVHRLVRSPGPAAWPARRHHRLQTVHAAGLAIDVPAAWASINVPASNTTGTNEAGNLYTTAWVDPGKCGGGMFPATVPPQVYVGTSPLESDCPVGFGEPVPGGDGLWVRDADSRHLASTTVAHGVLGGMDVTVVRNPDLPDPALDLVVQHGVVTTYVTIGVGADVSVARAIMHSLRPI